MKFKYLFSFLFFVQFLLFQNNTNAQSTAINDENTEKSFSSTTSSIKGIIVEEANGKTLPGATVSIKSLKLSTISDADGNFSFSDLEVGKYDVQVSNFGFDTKIVSDVDVLKGEVVSLTISLIAKKNALDEVVITKTKAKAESVKSLLTQQKNSIRVSDGISAETIKRTPDKTTSDVLKRISGASIQDNKFVIIRGLNDRYNLSFLNGAPLPSSEPDRKAFSFDIFPANMIDNLVIYKTASPDLPGEFAGGIIDITTKAVSDKNFQSISIGAGYNSVTTGKNQLYAPAGKTDWLGIDDGSRAFPTSFPSAEEFMKLQNQKTESSILQIAELAKATTSDWSLNSKNFSPNRNFQFSLGRNYKAKSGVTFGFVTSLTNTITNNFVETERKSYDTPGVLLINQVDNKYATQVLSGAIANFSLKLNANNTFNFRNLYSINSDNSVINRSGDLNQESAPIQQHTTARLFTSNSIFTTQLNGEHFLTQSKIKISWNGSYSNVTRTTPNDRRNTYIFTKNEDGTFTKPEASFQINQTGGDYPGTLFSSKNKESIYSSKIDVSRKFKLDEKNGFELKAGFFTQARFRDFRARQVGYIPFNGKVGTKNYNANTYDSTISFLDEVNLFVPTNMGILIPGKTSGLTLFDGTKPNDSYTAASNLNASYFMVDNAFGKFRLVWGLRLENYSQDLVSKFDNGKPVIVNNAQVDYLPSVNLIVGVNSKQNIRFSYSKTINRPEFRELAPFLFYDVSTRQNTQGTETLKIAKIQNYDFRYEFFPGKNQLLSTSLFYKKFENPIELQALANNSNKYQNAISGESKGFELEFRTLLSSVFRTEATKFLEDLTLFSNLAIIRSKVDISNLVKSTTLEDIPLQGQSPYVFNAGLQYLNKEKGWSYSANLNRIGDRIAIQGNQTQDDTSPALWEKSRTFLDMQLAKSFLNNTLEFKFNIQNVLAQDLIYYQNNDTSTDDKKGFEALINDVFTGSKQNKNGYDSAVDDIVWRTKFGRTYSLTVSYSF